MAESKPNIVKRVFAIRGMGQVITVFFGIIVLGAIFGLMNPNFLSDRNMHNLLRQIAPFLIVGIGQSYVLITGNIDLSIGSVLGMSCMISATLMTRGVNPWLAVVLTIVPAIATGVVNGLLVARVKLPPFIATLGTMTIARGIAQVVNGNRNTDAIGQGAQLFRDVFYYGRLNLFGVNFPYNTVWIALGLWLVFNFLLSRTRTGRHIYAVGSNREAAQLSGVNVTKTVVKAYTVSAFCACVAGLIQCAQGGLGTMDSGTTFELFAVAASVIGGVSTLGGQGILLGTIMGACVWGIMQNGLSLANVFVAYRNISVGIIVIISVWADIIVRDGRSRRLRAQAEQAAASLRETTTTN